MVWSNLIDELTKAIYVSLSNFFNEKTTIRHNMRLDELS